ncbi:MAG: peroxiredoxin [Rhodocyclaceae bacterium]|jgi:peroxiredoxin Q/BCP|nr:peroxiredoxin [Rhodocyclaceae bacterium]
MLQSGDLAPLFSLPDADMEMFDLAAARGKQHVVLCFYPRDNTPGCTRQAAEFSDHETDFDAQDCLVLGISPDDCLTHAEFRDEHGLSLRLLSDEDGQVCRLFDVWQPKSRDGATRMGVLRSTFIIDKGGIIRHAQYDVQPKGHALEVLGLVKELNSRNGNGNRQKHRRHPQL